MLTAPYKHSDSPSSPVAQARDLSGSLQPGLSELGPKKIARRPVPCLVTQLRIDHVNSVFSGLSATHLDRTVRFARSVIPGEGLSLVAVPASKVLTCSKILEHAVS